MAELGAGGGSGYPGALDTDSTPESSSTVARADVPNDLAAAVVAIQTELGTDPAGSLTDVKTNLQTEHGADGTHDNTKMAMLAGAQTVTGDKTVSGTTTFSGAPTLNGSAWPSFSANKNSTNQTITTGTVTVVTWGAELFDTNADFASNSFLPTVAGKYLLSATLFMGDCNDGDVIQIYLYKNSTLLAASSLDASVNATGGASVSVTMVVDANGVDDDFDIRMQHNKGSDATVGGTNSVTYFSGCRIG